MLDLRPAAETAADIYSIPMTIGVDIDQDLEAESVRGLYSLIDFKKGAPVLRAAGDTVLAVLDRPPTVLAAILSSDLQSRRTRSLLEWLESHGAQTPFVLKCQPGDAVTVMFKLAGRFSALARESETRRGRAVQEASGMNSANRELQYRFMIAEQALHRSGVVQPRLSFANPPVADMAQQVFLGGSEGALAQMLPLASGGLSAVGVHLASLGEDEAAELDARLLSLEDNGVLAHWVIPMAHMRVGWNLLGLARTPAGPDRTLELQLACTGQEGRLAALSLGMPQPIPDFQLRFASTGKPIMTNSLALQIWQFLPGVAPPHRLDVHRPLRPGAVRGGFVDIPLGAEILAQVEHANAHDVRFDFPAVVAPPGEGMVLCHPPSQGVTIGCLPNAAPGAALSISASAFVGHERSKDVDFSIVIADSPGRARDISMGRGEIMKHEGFSGWRKVQQGEVLRLNAFREAVGDRSGSIFIATRMTQPGDNSHAWARFRDFSLMVEA